MSTEPLEIEALLRSQAALIDELQARVARLEASGPARLAAVPSPTAEVIAASDFGVETSSRRGFLRLAGAAAAGAAVAAVANATPAAALDGGTYSGSETVFTNSTSTDPAKSGVKGTFTTAAVGGIGVLGQADTTSAAAGVVGASVAGYGVYGSAGTGYALYAGSNGRVGFDPHLTGTGAPTSGAYKLGDIVMNTAGDTFSCVVAGSGGAAKFRKLAGAGTTGQLHLSGAARIFDSRSQFDQPGGGGLPGGVITNAQTRTINVANYVPAGTTGVMIGLGVFGTASAGFLTAYPTGTPSPGTVNCFWQAGAQTSNTVIVALNASLQFDLKASIEGAGVGCSADIFGYFR